MAGRQRNHPFPTGVQERAHTDEQRPSPALDERCKGRLDVAVAAHFHNDELLSDRFRRGLHISSLPLRFRSAEGPRAPQSWPPWAQADAAAQAASFLTR